jgi:hypothetical protein
VRIALLVSNITIITGQCPESTCKYRELSTLRMAPLAKALVAGRYKISYGRRLTKSAILTIFIINLYILTKIVILLANNYILVNKRRF